MKQFPIYHQTGRTGISEWDNYILFAKSRLLPKIIEAIDVSKGKLFFTEGVDAKRFKVSTKSL